MVARGINNTKAVNSHITRVTTGLTLTTHGQGAGKTAGRQGNTEATGTAAAAHTLGKYTVRIQPFSGNPALTVDGHRFASTTSTTITAQSNTERQTTTLGHTDGIAAIAATTANALSKNTVRAVTAGLDKTGAGHADEITGIAAFGPVTTDRHTDRPAAAVGAAAITAAATDALGKYAAGILPQCLELATVINDDVIGVTAATTVAANGYQA